MPQRTTRSRRSGRHLLIPVVATLVVALAVLAVVVSRGSSSRGSTERETQPVAVSGSRLPPFSEGQHDPAVGQMAPDLRGKRFDGTPVAIVADGRPKLVAFVVHWCPHCQREVPVLAGWLRRGGLPEGVDFYGVATTTDPERPNYPPSAWLRKAGLDARTLVDDGRGTAASAFGMVSFPYFVALDGEGRVVAHTSGELTMAALNELVSSIHPAT